MHETTVQIPLIASLPFVLMLLTIAVAPLAVPHWWEKNRNKLIVSIVLSIPIIIYLLSIGMAERIAHQILFDYIPFIILLGSLFTITGGIYLEGDIAARPAINTLFMGIGAILASFMGTTGAAMLLIRPLIKTNSQRKYVTHTVLFFIAIVANCGGVLTPLGDPPLFLLYLRGVPFEWFFNLTKEWFVVNALLLTIYYFVDRYYYKKEPTSSIQKDEAERIPLKLHGKRNFLFLAGVILSVAFLNEKFLHFIHENHYYGFIREAVILSMALLALKFSKEGTRENNNFTWHPIVEVAFLFLGIFITMIPTLEYLQQNAQHLGVTKPWQFYFATGALSSFLDNAPTAISFHSLALGLKPVGNLIAGITPDLLAAISLGAVFFGSMTYIGNGPNFMVKAIAEENKISMPSFFGYMLKFSLVILLPIYILVALIFLL